MKSLNFFGTFWMIVIHEMSYYLEMMLLIRKSRLAWTSIYKIIFFDALMETPGTFKNTKKFHKNLQNRPQEALG